MTASTVSLVGDVRALADMVGSAQSVEDCRAVRDEVSTVLAAVESILPKVEVGITGVPARPAAVRELDAAVVHLGRAGGAIPVALAASLAAGDVWSAARELERVMPRG